MEQSELLALVEVQDLPVLVGWSGPMAVKELTTWNGSKSFFGALNNVMFTTLVGFAEVPGRILKQALNQLDVNQGDAISAAGTYLLRADVALDFRDQFKALVGDAA